MLPDTQSAWPRCSSVTSLPSRTNASPGAGCAGTAGKRPERCRCGKGRRAGGKQGTPTPASPWVFTRLTARQCGFFFLFLQCLETLHQSIWGVSGCIRMLFYTTSRTLNEHLKHCLFICTGTMWISNIEGCWNAQHYGIRVM